MREDHNPEVAGSNPAPATATMYNENPSFDGFFVYGHLVLTLCNIVLLE